MECEDNPDSLTGNRHPSYDDPSVSLSLLLIRYAEVLGDASLFEEASLIEFAPILVSEMLSTSAPSISSVSLIRSAARWHKRSVAASIFSLSGPLSSKQSTANLSVYEGGWTCTFITVSTLTASWILSRVRISCCNVIWDAVETRKRGSRNLILPHLQFSNDNALRHYTMGEYLRMHHKMLTAKPWRISTPISVNSGCGWSSKTQSLLILCFNFSIGFPEEVRTILYSCLLKPEARLHKTWFWEVLRQMAVEVEKATYVFELSVKIMLITHMIAKSPVLQRIRNNHGSPTTRRSDDSSDRRPQVHNEQCSLLQDRVGAKWHFAGRTNKWEPSWQKHHSRSWFRVMALGRSHDPGLLSWLK